MTQTFQQMQKLQIAEAGAVVGEVTLKTVDLIGNSGTLDMQGFQRPP